MSNFKNEFMEKKLSQKIIYSPYTLIFHYNTIRAKEWRSLKEKLFQKQKNLPISLEKKTLYEAKETSKECLAKEQFGNNTSMVVPLRILTKVFANFSIPTILNLNETKDQKVTGSLCLFFCKDLEEVKDILSLYTIQEKTVNQLFNPQNISKRIEISVNKLNQFLSIGVLITPSQLPMKLEEKNTKKSLIDTLEMNETKLNKITSFFNMYELEDILKLDFLYKTNDFHSINSGQNCAPHQKNTGIFIELLRQLNKNIFTLTTLHKSVNTKLNYPFFGLKRNLDFNLKQLKLCNKFSPISLERNI